MEQNQNPQPPVFNQPQGQQPAQPYQPRVMARPMMEPVEAVKTCFMKFFDFNGRARRSEYWWFMLFTLIVSWVFSFLGNMTPVFTYIGLIIGMVLWIPQFAALTRRLHDRNHSGWWVFAMFVCTLVAYGSFAVMLAPHMSALMGEGDNMATPRQCQWQLWLVCATLFCLSSPWCSLSRTAIGPRTSTAPLPNTSKV